MSLNSKSYLLILLLNFLLVGCSTDSKDFKRIELYQNQLKEITKTIDDGISYKAADDDLFNKYFEGLELINKEPQINDSIQLEFYSILSVLFVQKKFPNETIKVSKKGIEKAKNINHYEMVARLYSTSASNHLRLHQSDSALRVYREAIRYIKKKPPNIFALSVHNNLGVLFQKKMHQLDSALYHFNKLYKYPDSIIQNPNDQYFQNNIKDNIALVHMERKSYELARPLFEENYQAYKMASYENVKFIERWIRAGLQLAEADILLGNKKQSLSLISEIESHLDSLGNFGIDKPITDLLFYKVKSLYFEHTGDFELAHQFAEKRQLLLQKQEENKLYELQKSQHYYRNLNIEISKQHLLDEKKLRIEERKWANAQLWILVISSVSVLIIGLLLISRYRQRLVKTELERKLNAEKYKSEQVKKELLEQAITFKKRDLSNLSLNIIKNKEWLEELQRRLQEADELKGRSKGKHMKNIIRDIKKRLKNVELTGEMQMQVDTLNAEFYEKLLINFPALSKTELKLCSLIRLKIDNNDIASLQNIAVESVYKSRTRLRKKLNLTSNTDLESFLIEI